MNLGIKGIEDWGGLGRIDALKRRIATIEEDSEESNLEYKILCYITFRNIPFVIEKINSSAH